MMARTDSAYAWCIDTDHLAPGGLCRDEAGTAGPRNMAPQLADQLNSGGGLTFEVYDDDGEHYYTGRIVGTFEGHEPLTDFATPNAGATLITYPTAHHYDSEA